MCWFLSFCTVIFKKRICVRNNNGSDAEGAGEMKVTALPFDGTPNRGKSKPKKISAKKRI
jgi:hypothetical protein